MRHPDLSPAELLAWANTQAAAGHRVRLSAGNMSVTVTPGDKKSPGAERVRRYRERQKTGECNVTSEAGNPIQGVTSPGNVTHVTHVTPNEENPTSFVPVESQKEETQQKSTKQEGTKREKCDTKTKRIAEAQATSALPLPKDLETPAFREAWADWCEHRERKAKDDARYPWTSSSHRNTVRQCCDNGEAWAIITIRTTLANGWVGLHWDQRLNPADVRSQPLLPTNGNGHHKPDPSATPVNLDKWKNPQFQ